MSRQRLTDKVAADGDKGTGIMNDPYQVNNPAHESNDPNIQEYAKGDPEAWAEGVNKDNLWKKDKRDGQHIPEITAKMAAEAVQSARKLEERAVKCIVASQRILPGAEDSVIEAQAADLMHLPENSVDALLGRQEVLASSIAKAASDTSKEAKAPSEAQKKAQEKFKKMIEEKKKKAEKAASELAEMELALEAGEIPEVTANADADEDDKKDDEVAEDKEAAAKKSGDDEEEDDKEEDKEEEDKEAAAKKSGDDEEEDDKEEEKEASEEKVASDNLLDDIFASVTASDAKQGVKTLSGMVKKQASEGSDNLSDMWGAPPDVSKHFQ